MTFIDNIKALYRRMKNQYKSDADLLSKQLLQHISHQLQELSVDIETTIHEMATGMHKPADSVIEYIIKDRSGSELQSEWQDVDYVTGNDISSTAGYQSLAHKCARLGVSLDLIEDPCMEYDDEDRNRYIVRLSGWG